MTHKKIGRCIWATLAVLGTRGWASAPQAFAAALDFKFSQEIPEDTYKKIVQPIVEPLRFTFVQPAAPTGTAGFELGVAATGVPVPDEAKELATRFLEDGSDFPSYLAIPRIVAQKGLPFGIDFAANFAMIPNSEIILAGGAVQWALLDGRVPLPALALRAGYNQLFGTEALSVQVTNVEALLSYGVPPGLNVLNPYAGGGIFWVDAQSKYSLEALDPGVPTQFAAKAQWDDLYGLVGLQIAPFPFVRVAAEMQASKTQKLYSAKLSLGF